MVLREASGSHPEFRIHFLDEFDQLRCAGKVCMFKIRAHAVPTHRQDPGDAPALHLLELQLQPGAGVADGGDQHRSGDAALGLDHRGELHCPFQPGAVPVIRRCQHEIRLGTAQHIHRLHHLGDRCSLFRNINLKRQAGTCFFSYSTPYKYPSFSILVDS